MRAAWRCAVLLLAGLAPAWAADAQAIAIVAGASPPHALTPADIAALPAIDLHAAFATDHGPMQADFSGPLLWTVLDRAGALDAARPAEAVRQTVLITGRDGYTAVLALGEIAPAFEGKQVILAERMNGTVLAPDHFRIVVPGDRRGGRSVRDVVRIVVAGP